MVKNFEVVVNQNNDELVVQQLVAALRANDRCARQIRSFAADIAAVAQTRGLSFQPRPGQILACHFGLGFEVPENVKTRPVLVVSPKQRENTGLCVVVPISSKRPDEPKPYHFMLPAGLVPNEKYAESWIKGDMVVSVGLHRLDRFKVGFREYAAPMVPDEVLREARRCVLHAVGMASLTGNW
ncbi:MAG: hypothetical protein CML46_02130 [Rhodobacteraceae bacterium]|nr:hypothetical protein [Paracoccaceae bacterium]